MRASIGLSTLLCLLPLAAKAQSANVGDMSITPGTIALAGGADSGVPAPLNTAPPPTSSAAPLAAQAAPVPDDSGLGGYFAIWFNLVAVAQATQPHWMTPLVTVTPRLEEEVRYDQFWETRGNTSTLDVFDGGKGLELIPTETNEVLINPPAYQYKQHTGSPANGWLDDQFLVVKQRLLSANEENGNYIVTAFLGVTAGSGNEAFTNNTWVVTPTLAGGKGWGDFDIQATVGAPLPLQQQHEIGISIATNGALQYHLLRYLWPELEMNDTWWVDGKQRGGKNQVFLTPGIILGRFEIYKRVRFIIGGGYQSAITPKYVVTSEQTPAYNHAWIMTARVAF